MQIQRIADKFAREHNKYYNALDCSQIIRPLALNSHTSNQDSVLEAA